MGTEDNVNDIKREREVPGMFQGPIFPLLLKMSIPMFIGMIVQLVYNITDTIFISQIDPGDPSIIGGMGLVFPIIFFAMSLSNGLMVGVSSLVARAIGEKNHDVLDNTAESGLFVGLILCILTIVLTYAFGPRIVQGLGGAKEAAYAMNGWLYLKYIIPGAAAMFLGQVLMGILQGEGLMVHTMIGMIIGTVGNIILDPIFIFVFGLGIKGAALATVIAQTGSVIYVLVLFLARIPMVRIHWKVRNIHARTIGKIVSIGFPQALTQVIMSFSFVFFNIIVISIDPNAYTAFALVGRFDMAVLMPSIAIGSAVITIIGQNAARGHLDRAEKVYKSSILAGCTAVLVLAAAMVLSAPLIFPRLSDVPDVVDYAIRQVRVVEFTFLFAVFGIIGRSVFQAIGHPVPAIILTLLRLLIFSCPVAIISVFVFHWGVLGVWVSLGVGGGLSAVVSYFWIHSAFKRLKAGKMKVVSTS